ncbi:MAG: peptide-methionine (S)-S-oxide reductase MsrA [Filomicrobium sp.]
MSAKAIATALGAVLIGAMIVATKLLGGVPTNLNAVAAEPKAASSADGLEVATFGSGCFWCAESNFDKLPGVVSTISGYMGGKTKNPTYKTVSTGRTGHVEVLQVTYDPKKVKFEKVLDYFWRTTDILDGGGQFCDRGNHYRPVVFAHSAEQRKLAEKGKAEFDASGRFDRPVAVDILDASEFTAAEGYHQDYYNKNPLRYKSYRWGCGRDRRIMELWGENIVKHTGGKTG